MSETIWQQAARYGIRPLAAKHYTTQGAVIVTGNLRVTISARAPESTPRHPLVPPPNAPLAPGQAAKVTPLIRPAPFSPNGVAGPKPTRRFGPKHNPQGAQAPTIADRTRRWAAVTMSPGEMREIKQLGILAQKIILGFPIPANPGTPTAAHYKQRTLEDFCVAIRSIARCVIT